MGSVNSLACLDHSWRKVDIAEQTYKGAVSDYTKVFRPNHPYTLGERLSAILARPGEIYRRALSGYEKEMVPDHPHTLNAADVLGNCS
ncbi:uncharacterized protein BJX67DRAFT_244250 [Aspergillus lucknowensis]|uniref:Uncharacterized protein n=1 Tax=Aspergillus lucknowensis TaxID=176173 RepID=A0ABR4M1F7_9EURO